MRRILQRIFVLAASAFLVSSGASAYYYYVHFASRFAPYVAIPEKFDLTVLRNKTVYYFISDSGPALQVPGDSFTALISEIRAAAKVWNDVDSSDIRLAFGGLTAGVTPQSTPGIDVVFDDDIPPGLAALGGPTLRADGTATGPVGGAQTASFVAITRSTLHIRRDLHDQPSYGEDMFTTLVHEFGHTVGLQHTLTSGAMSTAITRATTKSRPLSADDIAGISVLYPAGSFLANTATISGRVTINGAGANLASVVAIASNGPAVSALTNPDGAYTIQGLPPGQAYYLYVHPLPQPTSAESTPANIAPPKNPDGVPLPASGAFDTVFYPGVKDPNYAATFILAAGDVRTDVNFSVSPRNAPAVSSVTTYGYPYGGAVHPAPLLSSSTGASMVAAGQGLLNGQNLAPGLSMSVLAQSGANIIGNSVKYYTGAYLQFGVQPTFGSNSGARHLIFSTANDIYVLPAGILLVPAAAPAISSVTPAFDDSGRRAAIISGSGFDGTTRILFDGALASIIRQNPDGNLLVSPPPASGGYRASVVALNGDGQSSLFVQPSAPAFIYDPAGSPAITITPSALAAGSEAMVTIDGVNTNFVDGQAGLGFGSSDITIRRIWVVGPNRILANVSVSPSASAGAAEVTVVSGLQVVSQPFGLQVLAANPRQVVMVPPVTNAATGGNGVPSGGTAVLTVNNLSATAGGLAVTVNDVRGTVLGWNGTQLTFQVPAGLAQGAAVVKLQTPSGDTVLPIVMNIDPAPPAIVTVYAAPGVALDASHPLSRGNIAGFLVANLPNTDPTNVHVNVGGVDHSAISVSQQFGGAVVQIVLNSLVPAGSQIPVTVSGDSGVSQPVLVTVR